MSATNIEWASDVWNPTTGCDRVSPGCDHCYALTMAKRLKAMGAEKYQRDGDPRTSGPGFGITEHPDVLVAPLSWRKPRRVFVNSMSDLFHAGVSDEFIARVWAVMALTPHITYQVLTKRHGRMRALLSSPVFQCLIEAKRMDITNDPGDGASDTSAWQILSGNTDGPGGLGTYMTRMAWPLPNVWLGVSAEDQQRADLRIPALLSAPAAVHWVSAEPLLGPIDIAGYLSPEWGVMWVVSGGESGPGARPIHPDWARTIRDQCADAGVPFHFKQWGAWAPVEWKGEDGATHAFTGGYYRENDRDVENFMALGHAPTSLERDDKTPAGAQGMRRLGKKAAGRLLDGVLHDAFPTDHLTEGART